jgi:nitrogen fixation protein FixH
MNQKKKNRLGLMFIVGVLFVGLVPNAFLVFHALSDPSFAVEEDYYEKSLRWNETRAQAAQSERLGWSLDVTIEPTAQMRGFRDLGVRVLDAGGEAKDNCAVDLVTFHNARAAQRIETRLKSKGDTHVSSLPMRRGGLWELRFDVSCDGERYTETRMTELGRVLSR